MDTNSNNFSKFVAPIIWIFLVVLQQPSFLIYWGFYFDGVSVLWRMHR
jgi:hypothetical protein